jgi:putative hydrolase of the HAD superfamily
MAYSTLFFDLDETLYPAESGLWPVIRERISLYMNEKLGISWDQIPSLRSHLYQNYGTNLRGLKVLYDIDEQDYLDFVHDIPITEFIKPAPEVRKILEKFHQKKVVFTNADQKHAARVIHALGLDGCFEQIIDIYRIWPYCKPMVQAYEIALDEAGNLAAQNCILLDDSVANLSQARSMGFYSIRVGKEELSSEYDASITSLSELDRVLGPIITPGG